ncbi:MAG: aminoacyl-tRNA hydrolase [Spiribacter sp.]|nr:aminoacyl-tRNA hydrolase [Spiribacter sp.]MDR9480305.1 aminoacyl-tRNA hydrolase [Spiribacter sp.]
MSAESVQLIVGLGNPGPKYEATRHNAGFWCLEALARQASISLRAERKFHGWTGRWQSDAGDVHLLCPATYMNHSGRAVAALMQFYRIDPAAVLVVHDEIDLSVGEARLKVGGGHGGHNGLRDIVAALGTPGFSRLRLGVGHPGQADQVVSYVLHAPGRAERDGIDQAIERALTVMPLVIAGARERAQQQLHTQG